MKEKLIFATLLSFSLVGLVASTTITGRPVEPKQSAIGSKLPQKEMKVVSAAGSSCRWGCDEANIYCTPTSDSDYAPYSELWWFPHWECGFSLGGDNCVSAKDVVCNVLDYYSDSQCEVYIDGSEEVRTSSLCATTAGPGLPPG